MSNLFRALIVLLLFVVPAKTSAQTDEQFARDVAAHDGNLRSLHTLRGTPARTINVRTIAGLAHLLDPNTKGMGADWTPYLRNSAVLFIAMDDDGMRQYLIGQDGLIAFAESSVSMEELSRLIVDLRLALKVDGIGESRAPMMRTGVPLDQSEGGSQVSVSDAAQELAANLFAGETVAGLRQVDHLIVIGNGVVSSLPFPMLPFGNGMLVDAMTVTISAGMFDLDMRVQGWSASSYDNALVVADPVVPDMENWRVSPLPGARAEGEAVANMFGGKLLIGEEATKRAIKRDIRRADLVYIAAHGVADPENPLDGGLLMLAGEDADDALWTGREVQTMRLPGAQMVVLSACQTGLGMTHEGGMIGMARSFQKAGVPRVVMSLWSVDDTATLFLMSRFNHYITQQVPAEALRLAMIDGRERYPEPRYWASFAVFGTPR